MDAVLGVEVGEDVDDDARRELVSALEEEELLLPPPVFDDEPPRPGSEPLDKSQLFVTPGQLKVVIFAVPKLVGALHGWLAKHATKTVILTCGDSRLEVGNTTSEQQEKLIDVWIAKCMGFTPG